MPRGTAAAAQRLRRGGARLQGPQRHSHSPGPRPAGRACVARGGQCALRGRGPDQYRVGAAGRRDGQHQPLGQLDVALPLAERRGCSPLLGRESPVRLLLRHTRQRAYGQGLALHEPAISRRNEGDSARHGHRVRRGRSQRRAQGGVARARQRQERVALPH